MLNRVLCGVGVYLCRLALGLDVAGEYGFKLVLPGFLEVSHVDNIILAVDGIGIGGSTDNGLWSEGVAVKLDNERAVTGVEQQVGGKLLVELEAHSVSDGHLSNCFRNAAEAY